MHIIGVGRLGQDADLRTTPGGDAVCNLNMAFNYGKPGAGGFKPTQWAEFSLWGKRAESLAQHLVKGTMLYVVAEDAHIEEFQKRDGTAGSKLVGRISSVEFAGSRQDGQRTEQSSGNNASTHSQSSTNSSNRPAPAQSGGGGGNGGFNDMGDDIPFATCAHDTTTRLARRMRRYV